MVIRELNKEEFKSFIDEFPFNSIYQTIEYGEAMRLNGYEVLYFGVVEGQKITGGSLLLINKIKNYKFAFAPRGFLMDYSNLEYMTEVTKLLKKFLNKHDIISVKFSPLMVKNLINPEGVVVGTNPKFNNIFEQLKKIGYYHFGFNSYFEAMKPRFEAIIDISQDYTLLFKNIAKEYKTKIRSAENRGVKIYRADFPEIGYLYDQLKESRNMKMESLENTYNSFKNSGMMDYYYAKLDTEVYLKTVKKKYEVQERYVAYLNTFIVSPNTRNSNKILSRKIDADKMLGVYKNQLIEATNLIQEYPTGIVLATVLISKHRNEIMLYLDTNNKLCKNISAKHLLIWKMIEKYSHEKFTRFNLGGVSDPRLTDNKFKGLNDFKTNFNASIIEYGGDFELVTNAPKYFIYQQTIQKPSLRK